MHRFSTGIYSISGFGLGPSRPYMPCGLRPAALLVGGFFVVPPQDRYEERGDLRLQT
jgi:hypothetical protein